METISALLALCAGNSLVTSEFSTPHPPYTHTKTSEAEFWGLLWSVAEQTDEQAIKTPVIYDAIMLIMTSL